MNLWRVYFFNKGTDVVLFYEDNEGHQHRTTRKVKNGQFRFNYRSWSVDELEEYGVVVR